MAGDCESEGREGGTRGGWSDRPRSAVDEAELDRSRGQAGAADLHVRVGRVERRGDLLGQWRLGEAGVALDAVERPFRTQHPLGVVVNRSSVWPDR